MVDIADNRPAAIGGLLPKGDLVVATRDSKNVSSNGPADMPYNVAECVKDLCRDEMVQA